MRQAIDIVLLIAALLLLWPAAVLFAELIAGTKSRSARRDDGSPPAGRLAVLMPAHDEAGGIALPIAAIVAQLHEGDRLLVVADNCTDSTAEVARAAGARVVERYDPARRGKGYALDFGVRELERDPPSVVVVVDADCIAEPGALDALRATCAARHRPVQALYLMHAPPQASLRLRTAAFAWLVKNKVRPAGAAALGWPCQLMGTGMAFPWATIRSAPLASGHLVEDMQLGLALAAAGQAPVFCPSAVVRSSFPADAAAARTQRTRWEHGHLSIIFSVVPHLLWRALMKRNGPLAAMAVDAMVPPVAALVGVLASCLFIDALWWATGGSAWPLAVSALALAGTAAGLARAWSREGRALLAVRELALLPFYIVAKLPIYLRLLTGRQVAWIRTKRDEHR